MSARGLDSQVRPAPPFDQGLFLLSLNRGKEHLRRGKYDEARRDFEAAHRLRPADPDVVSNLSFALFHLGHFDEAERMTRELLATHPESVPLLFNLGLILLKSGRQGEAKTTLVRVLELAPGHRKAHLTLGLILQRMGDAADARYHLRMAGATVREGADGDDTVARTARQATAEKLPPPHAVPVKPEVFHIGAPSEAAAQREALEPPQDEKKPSEEQAEAEEAQKAEEALVTTAPVAALLLEPPAVAAVETAPVPLEPAPEPGPGLALVGVEKPAPTFLPVEAAIPFSLRSGGFLSADCRNGIYVRRGVLTGRSGSPAVETEARLTGSLAHLLARASGVASLLLVDRGRRPFVVHLQGEFLSVDPGRLLAFEACLAFREDPAFEFRRQIARPFLKLFGSGAVALSVTAEPERLSVTDVQPLTISVAAVLGYGGNVTPELLEERDPLAELGGGPVLRFVGSGYVLAEAA